MAALGGHECDFLIEVSGDLKCPICQLVLNRPVQIEGCGHRFCRKCLDAIFERRSPRCPVDRRAIKRNKVFSDVACNRQILDLRVKCSVPNCLWEGELRDLEKHQKECPYEMVSCTNSHCHLRVTRWHLEEHALVYCSWRDAVCGHCSQRYPVFRKEEHMDVCKRLPISCKNGCAHRIPQEEMDSHIKNVCPLTVIPCEYNHLGCQTKVQRRLGKKHVEAEVRGHLDLACKRLKLAQEEITDLRHKGNTTPYVWKIDNFSALARQAKSANEPVVCDSPPFYIKRQGYKLQMSVKLCKRDNQDVSVVFAVHMLAGEYDSILRWPLAKMVQLTVIDQQGDGINKKNIVRNDRCYFHKCAGGVTGGSGTRAIVDSTLKRLQRRAYIANDAIFVNVKVGSRHLNENLDSVSDEDSPVAVAVSSSEDSDRSDDDVESCADLDAWNEEEELEEASNLDAEDGTNDNDVQLIDEEEEDDSIYEPLEAVEEDPQGEDEDGRAAEDDEDVAHSEEIVEDSEEEESSDDEEELTARGETSGSCRMQ